VTPFRAFLAFDLDPPLRDAASAVADALRSGHPGTGARWVAPASLHVTLRFLGTTDGALVGPLSSLVAAAAAGRAPIEVRVPSLVAFPQPRRARVLALALEDDGSMAAIAGRVEAEVRALGFAAEDRPFRAHVTLARLRVPGDLRSFVPEGGFAARSGRVTGITLYRSDLGPGGPRYSAVASAPFTASGS
jgi:2'-5' RNA ligase